MEGRNGVRFAEPQIPESGGLEFTSLVVDLVSDEEHGLLGASENTHELLVGVSDAHVRINDEHHGIGKANGEFSLFGDPVGDAFNLVFPTTRVDEHKVTASPVRFVEHAVTGHPGGIFDDRFAVPEDAIDEGRFSDVWPANHGEDREHSFIFGARNGGVLLRQEAAILLVEAVVFEAGAQ